MNKFIEINNISKSYNEVVALNNFSLEIEKGTLFGVIGPDGSGKTTLFRILTTLLVPDSGLAKVNGYDVVKDFRVLRKIIGYMPGNFSLYPDLTVVQNLEFYASVFGTSVNENYAIIEPVYKMLEPFRNRLSKNLSGGMKQKLALSCALIHKPDILVLDEPTTGVDAVSRFEFWDMLDYLKSTGMTILVSTPYMDEASKCDIIALMKNGEILDKGKPHEIISNFRSDLWEIKVTVNSKLMENLRNHPECMSAYLFGQSVHFICQKNKLSAGEMNSWLKSNNISATEIKKVQPTIEDCFISSAI